MRTSAASPGGGAWPATILIIDDHEIARAACRALLQTEGIDVIGETTAGDHAIAAANALRPDMALVDVTPETDTGFDTARLLGALPHPGAGR